ncbi:MAG: DUF4249 family protein, partial [Bacteroidota bacterium]
MAKSNIRSSFLILTLVMFLGGFKGCVEPFEIEDTISFESALVIEATITNVFQEQTVRLTRTFEFEDDGPQPESNAQVTIQIDNGTQFQFTEGDSGNYISNQPFQAEEGRVYTLNIRTADGRNYASREVRLTTDTPLENVSADRIVAGDGTEGMAILVDAFDPDNSSNFYRYEYDPELRYRQRYVDLVVNPSVKDTFIKRTK